MSKMDTYKHLDKDTALQVTMSMDEIATECVRLNYGAHRLLSSMVHALRASNEDYNRQREIREHLNSDLATGIEELLNKGLFY